MFLLFQFHENIESRKGCQKTGNLSTSYINTFTFYDVVIHYPVKLYTTEINPKCGSLDITVTASSTQKPSGSPMDSLSEMLGHIQKQTPFSGMYWLTDLKHHISSHTSKVISHFDYTLRPLKDIKKGLQMNELNTLCLINSTQRKWIVMTLFILFDFRFVSQASSL